MGSPLREENFAFAVEACGSPWSVYRFMKDGKRGMLAFRQTPQGKWEIGFLKAGEFTPEEVVAALQQALQ